MQGIFSFDLTLAQIKTLRAVQQNAIRRAAAACEALPEAPVPAPCVARIPSLRRCRLLRCLAG